MFKLIQSNRIKNLRFSNINHSISIIYRIKSNRSQFTHMNPFKSFHTTKEGNFLPQLKSWTEGKTTAFQKDKMRKFLFINIIYSFIFLIFQNI